MTSTLTHNEMGLRMVSEFIDGRKIETEFKWQTVNLAIVFKKDCWAVDQIRIVFRDDEASIELSEDMTGWKDLIRALPTYLPGCLHQEDWFQQVAFPPFATNPIAIFSRSQDEGNPSQ